MLSKKVIAKCLKDAVLECHNMDCRKCKYYKHKEWCLVYMQTDKIYETIKMKSFNINIFGIYEFIKKGEYSYIDEYGDIVKEKYNRIDKVNGGVLIDYIKDILSDPNLTEIHFIDNIFNYSTFNPENGTGENMTLTITEVNNGQKANKLYAKSRKKTYYK